MKVKSVERWHAIYGLQRVADETTESPPAVTRKVTSCKYIKRSALQPDICHDVLKAQQKAIDRNPRMPFYNLNIDAGALWARRKIDSLLRSERGHRLRLGYFGR